MLHRIAIMLLLATSPALAQSLSPLMPLPGAPMPRTMPFTDPQGKQVGTATVSYDVGTREYRTVLRDLKGELIGTIVVDRHDNRILYDPNGKVIDQFKGQ